MQYLSSLENDLYFPRNDQAYTIANLRRILQKSDFFKWSHIRNSSNLENDIQRAISHSLSGFVTTPNFKTAPIKNKTTYNMVDFSEVLYLRKALKNIQTTQIPRQANRNFIVKNLKSILEEGLPYRVHRIDIRRFYESFNIENIIDDLNKNEELSHQTKKAISSFLTESNKHNQSGIPRGVPLSATLIEYAMRNFDYNLKSRIEVFFYCRYVDDIIIVTSKKIEHAPLIEEINKILPQGLVVNKQKTKEFTPDSPLTCIEFLGYKFKIEKQKTKRIVKLDIADTKVKKIKKKITTALIKFQQHTRDFNLLRDRIKILTSNYNVKDKNRTISINVGIYYNYRYCDAQSSAALTNLDNFLKRSLFIAKGKMTKKSKNTLSTNELSILLGHSFRNGFENHTDSFVHFNAARQRKIQRCWTYG